MNDNSIEVPKTLMQAFHLLLQADCTGNWIDDGLYALACDSHGSAATEGQEAN